MTILHRIFHHIDDAARPLARLRLCLCLLIVGVIVELSTAAASHAALVSTTLDQVLQSTGIGIFVVAMLVLVGALWLGAIKAARRVAASRLSFATATILSEAILLAPFVPLVSQVQGSSNLEVLTSTIPASMLSAAGTQDFYYHTDDLYNVMAITDETGAVADAGNERYEYADYGQPVDIFTLAKINGTPSAVGNPYNFTSRRYDPETGWYYCRTRYLDPHAGRFVTRDSIGVWGDPFGHGNGYGYVESNPYTHRDPDGRRILYGDRGVDCKDVAKSLGWVKCVGDCGVGTKDRCRLVPVANNKKIHARYKNCWEQVAQCVREHERKHIEQWKADKGTVFCKCTSRDNPRCKAPKPKKAGKQCCCGSGRCLATLTGHRESEAEAHWVGLNCLIRQYVNARNPQTQACLYRAIGDTLATAAFYLRGDPRFERLVRLRREREDERFRRWRNANP